VLQQHLLLLLCHFKWFSVTSINALTCNVPVNVYSNMRYKIVAYLRKKIHYLKKFKQQQRSVFLMWL